MRNLALIGCIFGILLLAGILILEKPIKISSTEDLFNLQDNQKVYVSGQVIEEKALSNSRLIILNNNIEIYCDCNKLPKLKDKSIQAIGIIDNFSGKIRINVLKISYVN